MDRQEYLKIFFEKVKKDFCVDLSKDNEYVRFALECKRQNKNTVEAYELFQEKKCLIKIIRNDGN